MYVAASLLAARYLWLGWSVHEWKCVLTQWPDSLHIRKGRMPENMTSTLSCHKELPCRRPRSQRRWHTVQAWAPPVVLQQSPGRWASTLDWAPQLAGPAVRQPPQASRSCAGGPLCRPDPGALQRAPPPTARAVQCEHLSILMCAVSSLHWVT